MIELAFTTRIPLTLMTFLGLKRWENRSSMPVPAKGSCAITCSKSSDWREYKAFIVWARTIFPSSICAQIPPWDDISEFRGKIVAVCDYEASYTAPNPPVWDEGYPVWWHLTNVRLLDEPISCRGNVGMWRLPTEIQNQLNQQIGEK